MLDLQTKLIGFAISLVLLSGVAYGTYRWAYNRGAAHERAVYEGKVQEAAVKFADELAKQQVIIEGKNQEIAAARRQSNTIRETVEGALANEPESHDWGDDPLPGIIRLQLEAAARHELPQDSGRPH
jgi:hypothetical protein